MKLRSLVLGFLTAVSFSVSALATGLAPPVTNAPPPVVTGQPQLYVQQRIDNLGNSTPIGEFQQWGFDASGSWLQWINWTCGADVATHGGNTSYCLLSLNVAGTLDSSLFIASNDFCFYIFGACAMSMDTTYHFDIPINFVGSMSAVSCGTGPAIVSGSNDNRGAVTTGTGAPTACSVNFAETWTAAPFCSVVEGSGGDTAIGITSISTTQLVLVFSAGLTSKTIYWVCIG